MILKNDKNTRLRRKISQMPPLLEVLPLPLEVMDAIGPRELISFTDDCLKDIETFDMMKTAAQIMLADLERLNAHDCQ